MEAVSHDPWIKITMAVKALILEGWPPGACRQIHDAWSATAGDMLSESGALKYEPAVVLGQWDSVEAEGRTDVGTLFENDYTGAAGAPGEAWARAATKAFCDEWLLGGGPAGPSSPNTSANPEIVRLAGLLDAGQIEEFGIARKTLLKKWKGVTADVLDKEIAKHRRVEEGMVMTKTQLRMEGMAMVQKTKQQPRHQRGN